MADILGGRYVEYQLDCVLDNYFNGIYSRLLFCKPFHHVTLLSASNAGVPLSLSLLWA